MLNVKVIYTSSPPSYTEAVPRAAGVFTWTKLCAICCPDAAAAAVVPSEARTAAAAVVSPSGRIPVRPFRIFSKIL